MPVLALLLVVLLAAPAWAQQNLGNVQVNQLLTTGGANRSLKVPTMTQAERDSFSHGNGEIVDCSNCAPPGGYMYMNGVWVFMGGAGGGGIGPAVANQVTVWNGPTTVTGYPGLKFDPTTYALTVCSVFDAGATCRGFIAPPFVSPATIVWTLPAADGAPGNVLRTNGSGILSWTTAGAGTVTGSGTTNRLTKWTDGVNGILGDSILLESANTITMSPGSGVSQQITATNNGNAGAPINIRGGPAAVGSNASGGSVALLGGVGDGIADGGSIQLTGHTQFPLAGRGGDIGLEAGHSGSSTGGQIELIAGNGPIGGGIALTSGDGASGAGGPIVFTTGGGSPPGRVLFEVGPLGFVNIQGTVNFEGATGGTTGLRGPPVAGAVIFTLPAADGSSGQCLRTDGAGTWSFGACGGAAAVGSCAGGGNLTIADLNTTGSVTFSTPLADALYGVVVSARSGLGNPAVPMATAKNLTAAGFDIEISNAPGTSKNTIVSWVVTPSTCTF
jgi:hypothetical protein